MSKLLKTNMFDFYINKDFSLNQNTFEDIININDENFSVENEYINYLFPENIPETILNSEFAQRRFYLTLEKISNFLGYNFENLDFHKNATFYKQEKLWLKEKNIDVFSRIFNSIKCFGYEKAACNLKDNITQDFKRNNIEATFHL